MEIMSSYFPEIFDCDHTQMIDLENEGTPLQRSNFTCTIFGTGKFILPVTVVALYMMALYLVWHYI